MTNKEYNANETSAEDLLEDLLEIPAPMNMHHTARHYTVDTRPGQILRVREAPGFQGKEAGTKAAGEVLDVVGITDGWAELSDAAGYVMAKYLKEVGEW